MQGILCSSCFLQKDVWSPLFFFHPFTSHICGIIMFYVCCVKIPVQVTCPVQVKTAGNIDGEKSRRWLTTDIDGWSGFSQAVFWFGGVSFCEGITVPSLVLRYQLLHLFTWQDERERKKARECGSERKREIEWAADKQHRGCVKNFLPCMVGNFARFGFQEKRTQVKYLFQRNLQAAVGGCGNLGEPVAMRAKLLSTGFGFLMCWLPLYAEHSLCDWALFCIILFLSILESDWYVQEHSAALYTGSSGYTVSATAVLAAIVLPFWFSGRRVFGAVFAGVSWCPHGGHFQNV